MYQSREDSPAFCSRSVVFPYLSSSAFASEQPSLPLGFAIPPDSGARRSRAAPPLLAPALGSIGASLYFSLDCSFLGGTCGEIYLQGLRGQSQVGFLMVCSRRQSNAARKRGVEALSVQSVSVFFGRFGRKERGVAAFEMYTAAPGSTS